MMRTRRTRLFFVRSCVVSILLSMLVSSGANLVAIFVPFFILFIFRYTSSGASDFSCARFSCLQEELSKHFKDQPIPPGSPPIPFSFSSCSSYFPSSPLIIRLTTLDPPPPPRPKSDSAKRLRSLHGDWSAIAEQFSDVYTKFNNTALQLQAAHDPPSAESKVRPPPPSTSVFSGSLSLTLIHSITHFSLCFIQIRI